MSNLGLLKNWCCAVIRLQVSARHCKTFIMKEADRPKPNSKQAGLMMETADAMKVPSLPCTSKWTVTAMPASALRDDSAKRQRGDSTSQEDDNNPKKAEAIFSPKKKRTPLKDSPKRQTISTVKSPSRPEMSPPDAESASKIKGGGGMSAKASTSSVTSGERNIPLTENASVMEKERNQASMSSATAREGPGPGNASNKETERNQFSLPSGSTGQRKNPWPVYSSSRDKSMRQRNCLKRRHWEKIQDHNAYMEHYRSRHHFSFTLASYNVLAQNLLEDHAYLYNRTPDRFLDWNYRKSNLISEIEEYSPQILCMQEVQESQFNEFFLPELNKRGYYGIHKARTGDKSDGCAIFFKTSKFTLEQSVPVSFYRSDVEVLDRDNVGLLLKLSPISSQARVKTSVVIATTHLLFNPRRGDVKLAQLMLLLAEIDKLSFDPGWTNGKAAQHCPVILCGDFNAFPYSPLYDLLLHGRLDLDNLEQRHISGQLGYAYGGPNIRVPLLPHSMGIMDTCQYGAELSKRHPGSKQNFAQYPTPPNFANGNDQSSSCSYTNLVQQQDMHGTTQRASGFNPHINSGPNPNSIQGGPAIYHPFKFQSVYEHDINRSPKHQFFTSSHTRDVSNVDHIFYHSRPHPGQNSLPLRLSKRLKLLTVSEQQRHDIFLPNEQVSSDHLILFAKFNLRLK